MRWRRPAGCGPRWPAAGPATMIQPAGFRPRRPGNSANQGFHDRSPLRQTVLASHPARRHHQEPDIFDGPRYQPGGRRAGQRAAGCLSPGPGRRRGGAPHPSSIGCARDRALYLPPADGNIRRGHPRIPRRGRSLPRPWLPPLRPALSPRARNHGIPGRQPARRLRALERAQRALPRHAGAAFAGSHRRNCRRLCRRRPAHGSGWHGWGGDHRQPRLSAGPVPEPAHQPA